MKARYFCDGCGAEVGARADRCPGCGKHFAAVRCPGCGYQGKAHEFARGCPVCGYLANETVPSAAKRVAPPRRERGFPLSRGAALATGAALLVALVVLVAALLRG